MAQYQLKLGMSDGKEITSEPFEIGGGGRSLYLHTLKIKTTYAEIYFHAYDEEGATFAGKTLGEVVSRFVTRTASGYVKSNNGDYGIVVCYETDATHMVIYYVNPIVNAYVSYTLHLEEDIISEDYREQLL